ncbi:hypothetical protein GEMRC1_000078 [Eukaryota sp. GEM-RC1]
MNPSSLTNLLHLEKHLLKSISSLWFLEFGDKLENPIDFSHLPVSSDNFLLFIKSFYERSFTLNEDNAYEFFYLVHYFQVDKLIHHVENHLNTHLVTWAWLKPFIKEADERNDLRALEFVGPFFSKIDDLLIDDVMAITTEGFKMLVKYCTSSQSQSWFVKSIVESILNQSLGVNHFLNILNSCPIQVMSLQQWNECLTAETHLLSQSKMIKFSQTKKHSQLQVSGDGKRVVVGGVGNWRNILGEDPLLPGNVYTWKLRYQGEENCLDVGVIDESKYSVGRNCNSNLHGLHVGGTMFGCLPGYSNNWKPGELLEINANLVNNTLNIKSVSNSSINLTGTLPRLSSGNYYLFARLDERNHVLEIVE